MSKKSWYGKYQNSTNTNQVISKVAKKVERPETKETKKGEKEMKKSNKTNKIERKENVKEMKENTKETKKLTLTERVSNLESFAKKQLEFNSKMVSTMKDKFSELDKVLSNITKPQASTSTKETKKEVVKKDTKKVAKKENNVKKENNKKKATSQNTNKLKELVDNFVSTNKLGNIEKANVYRIINYLKKKKRNRKQAIEDYMQYNKDNKIKYVNKVVNFYVNEKLSQYMA